MTQVEKDLLLKDLCARIPYGVKVQVFNYGIETVETLYQIDLDGYISTIEGNELKYSYKPYLFPLSSMTEEQRCEYHNHCDVGLTEWGNELYYDCAESFDWLNAHHFDYKGLIEKSLALDATNLNIY